MCQGRLILHRAIPVSSDVGYARKKQSTGYKSLPHRIRRVFERRNAQKPELYGRNVTVTPWSGCDEYGHHLCKVRGTQLTQDKPDDKM